MKVKSKSKATVRYTFDEVNRLVVRKRSLTTQRLGASRILRGRVTTDRQHTLVYRVETEPTHATSPQGEVPHAVTLDGAWSLTADHQLKLRLRKAQGARRRQTIHLRGTLARADAHSLTFALRRFGRNGRTSTQHLTLQGRWEADRWNRLSFLVRRAQGASDRLTFQGAWTVDRRHTLRYRFQERVGIRRTTRWQELRLNGTWALPRAHRLAYQVEGNTRSVLTFRAVLQSPKLHVGQHQIAYQVGIRLGRTRRVARRVTLFGTWTLHRDLSMSFEMVYPKGQRRRLQFSATYAMTRGHTVQATLLSTDHEPLGITLTLTKRWMQDTSFFLQLRKTGAEAAVLGGAHIRF